MRVIIAGSRNMPVSKYRWIARAVELSGFVVTEVVCGLARGADTLGKRWAEENQIPVTEFPAEWDKFGKSAGPRRNKQMADHADALIVFIWDNSRGSQNMLNQMRGQKKPCFIIRNGAVSTS